MQFKVWFTKANKDLTVRASDPVWVKSQDSFMEFVSTACAGIFGKDIVPDFGINGNLLPAPSQGADVLTELRGNCPVRLTVNGPSKDINRRRHPIATHMMFHWEVDVSQLSHMTAWLDDDNAVTGKTVPTAKTEPSETKKP